MWPLRASRTRKTISHSAHLATIAVLPTQNTLPPNSAPAAFHGWGAWACLKGRGLPLFAWRVDEGEQLAALVHVEFLVNMIPMESRRALAYEECFGN